MTSFQDQWAPTWVVMPTIPGAKACVIENTGRAFRSGRPSVDAVFFDGNRKEICRRTGMRLTSKKGHEYVVCKKDPERGTGLDLGLNTQIVSVGELFDDL